MGIAQGKKVDPAPLRLRRSRRSRPSARSSQREAAWLARPEQRPREKTWRTSHVLHKRLGMPGEEKEPWRRKRRRSPPRPGHRVPLPASTGRPPSRQISPRIEDVSTSGPLPDHARARLILKAHSNYQDELGQLDPLCSRPSNGCAEPAGGGLPLPSGFARSVIRRRPCRRRGSRR
jgi:hypothetical protein